MWKNAKVPKRVKVEGDEGEFEILSFDENGVTVSYGSDSTGFIAYSDCTPIYEEEEAKEEKLWGASEIERLKAELELANIDREQMRQILERDTKSHTERVQKCENRIQELTDYAMKLESILASIRHITDLAPKGV